MGGFVEGAKGKKMAEMKEEQEPAVQGGSGEEQEKEEEEQVKCYNCTGEGHFARKCPSNRNVLKFATDPVECRKCKGKGHFARVCTSRDKDAICYNCGGYFHIATECRKIRGGQRGGRGRGGARVSKEADDLSNALCYACNKTGHLSYDCPNPDSTESSGTRGRGRRGRGRGSRGSNRGGRARTDSGDRGDASSKTCFVCEEVGHLSYDCPNSSDKE